MSRVFKAHTPLGDTLLFQALSGQEAMSRPFDIRLSLLSLDPAIPMHAILGQSLTVEIERQDQSRRYVNGFATEFTQLRRCGRHHCYEARLRPQLWFLTQTRDFRIFQHMSARDIVKQVLADFGIPFKDLLCGYFRPREYTVCYGETYFDFCSRLMEEEGIGYWIEHALGSHQLVLADSLSASPTLPSHAHIPYYPPEMAVIPDEECVAAWGIGQTLNPGQAASRDYDFKKPRANLDIIQPKPRNHPHNRYEQFAYPGRYRELGDGENYARIRIEALQTAHERAQAHSNVRGIMPGHRFCLTRCPRPDQNREYLIIAAQYDWQDNSYETAAASTVTRHETRFTAQPTSEPYRPPRITPQPVAHAADSAIVSGPPGQEIWTDAHGRVKVKFHWDRHGPGDQDSSCWVRISQPWAGTQFGMIQLPRIGQEVLVGYVDNNPDHPVIVGRLYNADHMPPWALPANATQSGILTRSSREGGYDNANAIRFEDKKGEEQLWLHAEKDQLTEVEHDEDKWVGHDRRKTIDRDETTHVKRDRAETVDRDETITVHGQRTEVVDGNETVTIHSNRTERVDRNEKISIGLNRDEDVGANETISIGNNRDSSIGSNRSDKIGSNWSMKVGMFKTETIGMAYMQNVGLGKMVNIGAAYNLNIGAMMFTNVGVSRTDNIGKNHTATVGKLYTLVVGAQGGGETGGASADAGARGESFAAESGSSPGASGGKAGGGAPSTIVMDNKSILLQIGESKISLEGNGTITLDGIKILINGKQVVDVDGKQIDLN